MGVFYKKLRTAALQKIQEREKRADARVRQRLRDRRKKNLESEKTKINSTKVVPVAHASASAAVAATVTSIPAERTIAQKDIDALRKTIHDKIGNENILKTIFGKLDKDNTLTLSTNEFKRLIASVLKSPPTKNIFKAIWQDVCHLRKTGDGVKEIDFETFKAWLDF
jgi:hypothetical protein